MKTTAECQDKSGKVLDKTDYSETNPFPDLEPPYSRVANVDRNGNIEIEDSTGNHQILNGGRPMTEEQRKKFEEHMKQVQENINHQNEIFNRQMNEFNRNMQEMQNRMAQTFGNNFPFGNSNPFGNNFPFGNSNPFGNNFPFDHSYPQFQFYYPTPNFHTFFYPSYTNNQNGFTSGVYDYDFDHPSTTSAPQVYNNHIPDTQESQFAVEEFKPVYKNNRQPSVISTSNRFDKYQRAY